MFIQPNDKDKIYSNVVIKEPVTVIIQTTKHLLTGKIFFRPDEELKEERNRPETFFELFDVTVFDDRNQPVRHCKTLAVNRSHMIWIYIENNTD